MASGKLTRKSRSSKRRLTRRANAKAKGANNHNMLPGLLGASTSAQKMVRRSKRTQLSSRKCSTKKASKNSSDKQSKAKSSRKKVKKQTYVGSEDQPVGPPGMMRQPPTTMMMPPYQQPMEPPVPIDTALRKMERRPMVDFLGRSNVKRTTTPRGQNVSLGQSLYKRKSNKTSSNAAALLQSDPESYHASKIHQMMTQSVPAAVFASNKATLDRVRAQANMPGSFNEDNEGSPRVNPRPVPVNLPGSTTVAQTLPAVAHNRTGPAVGLPATGGPAPQTDVPPSQVAARAGEIGVPQPPMGGDTVWQTNSDVPPRHSSDTNAFLARTLMTIRDDRVREMGFELLNSSELTILPSNDPQYLHLANTKNPQNTVRMSEGEFLKAMEFFADESGRPLVEADAATKAFAHILDIPEEIREAFSLETQVDWDTPGMPSVSWFKHPLAQELLTTYNDQADSGMSDEQKNALKMEIMYQASLDWHRDKFRPVVEVEGRRQTWGEFFKYMLTLGYASTDNDGTITATQIANAMQGATPRQREEARMALEDMKRFRILWWDNEGHLVRPGESVSDPSMTLNDSNIVNLVHHMFSPTRAHLNEHIVRYQPTGWNYFAKCVMMAMSNRDQVNKESGEYQEKYSTLSEALKPFNAGKALYRIIPSGRIDIIRLATNLLMVGSKLGLTLPALMYVLIYMSDLSMESFGKVLSFLGLARSSNEENTLGHNVLGWVFQKFGSYIDPYLSDTTQNALQAGTYKYGDYIVGWALTAFSSVLILSGSAMAYMAMGAIRGTARVAISAPLKAKIATALTGVGAILASIFMQRGSGRSKLALPGPPVGQKNLTSDLPNLG